MTKAAFRTLISLVAGLAIGVVISSTHAPALRAFATALEPVGTAWVNAIRMTVIPLVASLLIATIAEENDLRAVGRLGVRAVALFSAIKSLVGICLSTLRVWRFERLIHFVPG